MSDARTVSSGRTGRAEIIGAAADLADTILGANQGTGGGR